MLPLGSQQWSALARPSPYIGPFNLLNLGKTATHGKTWTKRKMEHNLHQNSEWILKALTVFFHTLTPRRLRFDTQGAQTHFDGTNGPSFRGARTPNNSNPLIYIGLISLDLVGTDLFQLSGSPRPNHRMPVRINSQQFFFFKGNQTNDDGDGDPEM